MNDAGPRYALYFAPDPASALWRFGSACLGYDAATGERCEALQPPGFSPDDWARLTEEPRRYGFHATLKAPFHLVAGIDEALVMQTVQQFAQRREAFTLPTLRVALLSRFVALVPELESSPLQELAARAVEALEPLRAPLSAKDVQRRLKSPLTPVQTQYLERWGYPYVFDQFRFHLTLTGAIEAPQREAVLAALTQLYASRVPVDAVAVDAVALFRQDRRDGPFRIILRAPLGSPQRA